MSQFRRILIVEDELVIAENTKLMIKELYPEVSVDVASSSSEALEMIDANRPDLAFLDIRLGKHDNGIELSKSIVSLNIPFIFLTAHGDERTVSEALQSEPVGYLVKPISKQDLLVNLKLAMKKIANQHFYIFRDGTHDVRLREDLIIFLQVDGNYTEIHTEEKRYVERKSMTRVLDDLNVELIRIHRNCYVNPAYVVEANASVYLSNGEVLPISRNYKKNLQNLLFSK